MTADGGIKVQGEVSDAPAQRGQGHDSAGDVTPSHISNKAALCRAPGLSGPLAGLHSILGRI